VQFQRTQKRKNQKGGPGTDFRCKKGSPKAFRVISQDEMLEGRGKVSRSGQVDITWEILQVGVKKEWYKTTGVGPHGCRWTDEWEVVVEKGEVSKKGKTVKYF